MNIDVGKTAGLSLSQQELDEIVPRLCFFAPSGSGEYLRDLHEFLALQALSMLPSGQRTAMEVFEKVKATIGFRVEYEEIHDALARLAKKNDIRCTLERPNDPHAQFLLPIDRRNEMRRAVREEEALEREVLEQWKQEVQGRYPHLSSADIDRLEVDLKAFSLRLLSQHSIEALQLYYGDDESLNLLLERMQAKELSDVWQWWDEEKHLIRLQEVTGFFRQPTDRRKQYIASLTHSLFILHLTQLDPQCAAIIRTRIPGGTVFLDTNFVFRLIGLQGPDFFRASGKLVDISKRLGYRLVISPETKAEYDRTLLGFLRHIQSLPLITSELAELALTATSDEDFHTAYWREVAKRRGDYVDPRNFYEYYQHVDVILESDHGVTIDDNYHEDVKSNDAEIAAQASLIRRTMEDFYGPEAADQVSQIVLDHDAYHRLLILKLRGSSAGQETFTNVQNWFLTCDSKLPLYDRVARGGNRQRLPYCALSGQWLQTLRPFVGREESLDDAQVEMLISPLLRAYRRPPAGLINDIIGRLSMRSTYSVNVVGAMLSNQQFLEQFRAAPNETAEQDLIDSFYAEYAVITEGELKETKERLQQTQDDLSRANEQLNSLGMNIQKRDEELTDALRDAARNQIHADELARTLDEARTDAKIERERREQEESRHSRELAEKKLLIERQQQQNAVLKFFVIVGVWGLYAVLRRPVEFELVASIVTAFYFGAVFVFSLWRSSLGVWTTLIIPVLLLISLGVSALVPDFRNAASVFGILVAAVRPTIEGIKQVHGADK
ncbi:MAG: hypothetical protein JXB38_13015 [Anaerolineales bacterium]|nr:hypothetical protein [Anaerolineales bacterium]